MIDPCDVTRTSVRVFVTAVRSPLSYLLLGQVQVHCTGCTIGERVLN